MTPPVDSPTVPVSALDAFVGVLSEADAGSSTDAFYGRLCEVICRLGSMERAVLFRYDEQWRRVRAAGAHGMDLAVFEDVHVNVDTAPIARRALEADDVVDEVAPFSERLPPEFARLLGDRVFCVPLAAAGRWIGVVLCDRPGRRTLSKRQHDLLWTLGKSAALAAVARIATFEGGRARELQQRIDLAREVHDGVVQRLFGVSMALQSPADLPAAERRRAAAEIQGALGDLREVMQRPLAASPRPTLAHFRDELRRQMTLGTDLPIAADVRCEVPRRLEPLAQSVLIEALRNVRKHASPTRVEVRALREDGAFILEIANDGAGGGNGRHSTGMGLRLAAFEALQEGGFVEFGHREPGVWKVRLVVPVSGDG
jgi:hypothetical protein